jgi:hypothetical protein
MTTDSNQVCFDEMSVCGLQEVILGIVHKKFPQKDPLTLDGTDSKKGVPGVPLGRKLG